jgi:predicted transglutaminase-like cysteine proteinase
LKRPSLASALLLAAALLISAPFAGKEAGWVRMQGSALGMGAAPDKGPDRPAQNTTEPGPAGEHKAETAAPQQPPGSIAQIDPGPEWVQGQDAEKKADSEPLQDQVEQRATAPRQADAPPVAQTDSKPWRAGSSTAPDRAGTERTQDQGAAKGSATDAAQGREAQTETKPWRADGDAAAGTDPARTQGQGAATRGQPVRLFQTAAFRGSFDALPKWKRVLSKAREQVRVLGSCQGQGCPAGATSWQRIMGQTRGRERMEQLKLVNEFFNKWPYRLDMDAYGVSDWWATPQEFLKISGDCEDYAIIKYFALRELGFPADDLRVVILKDQIRGIAHAVLTVFLHGDAYVLDNVSSMVFTHGKYKHYVPYYSLNEHHRWSHIPVGKQP